MVRSTSLVQRGQSWDIVRPSPGPQRENGNRYAPTMLNCAPRTEPSSGNRVQLDRTPLSAFDDGIGTAEARGKETLGSAQLSVGYVDRTRQKRNELRAFCQSYRAACGDEIQVRTQARDIVEKRWHFGHGCPGHDERRHAHPRVCYAVLRAERRALGDVDPPCLKRYADLLEKDVRRQRARPRGVVRNVHCWIIPSYGFDVGQREHPMVKR